MVLSQISCSLEQDKEGEVHWQGARKGPEVFQ